MRSHLQFFSRHAALQLLLLLTFGILLPAAELTGWIEEQPTSVDLTATKSVDWIQCGFNGDATTLNRKSGADLISGLTILPSNRGAVVCNLGATFSWSDGSPSAHCRGTTAGVHAKGESRSIRFSVPADTNPRTVKIYFSSVHAAVTVTAQVSDGSSPNWVNGDWDATTGSITPVATLSYSAASPNQTLSVTVAVAAGNDWPSVGIHAVTLKAGATATPPPPKPPAPTGVYASAGKGRVIVQWDQMPRVDRYSIYRSSTSSLPSTPWRTNILPIQDNRDTHMLVAADTAATNGTTWHYWVSSITAGGETLTSSAVTATPSNPGTTAITRTRRLSVMPLGDSITFGFPSNGGYRPRLLEKLVADGFQIQMAGRVKNNSSGMAQPFHEGWPGWSVQGLRDTILDQALPIYQPDLILLMIGTNNLASEGKSASDVETALAAFDGLLAKVFTLSPISHVIVSPILPIKGVTLTESFNHALMGKITAMARDGRRVSWCSAMSSIALNQLPDGIHPGGQGYELMANAWHGAIQAITSGDPKPDLSPRPTSE